MVDTMNFCSLFIPFQSAKTCSLYIFGGIWYDLEGIGEDKDAEVDWWRDTTSGTT